MRFRNLLIKISCTKSGKRIELLENRLEIEKKLHALQLILAEKTIEGQDGNAIYNLYEDQYEKAFTDLKAVDKDIQDIQNEMTSINRIIKLVDETR